MHRYDLCLHDNTRVFIYVALYYKYYIFFLLFVFYSTQAFFILYLYFLLILTIFMLNIFLFLFQHLMHQALCFNICVCCKIIFKKKIVVIICISFSNWRQMSLFLSGSKLMRFVSLKYFNLFYFVIGWNCSLVFSLYDYKLLMTQHTYNAQWS